MKFEYIRIFTASDRRGLTPRAIRTGEDEWRIKRDAPTEPTRDIRQLDGGAFVKEEQERSCRIPDDGAV